MISKSGIAIAAVAAVAAAGLGACARTRGRPAGSVTAAQQFEKIKSLEGTWKTVPGSPMEATIVYRAVGGGTTVQETIFPGAPHEMVTMYHLDGDTLMLTHYCAAGNQPTMRALPSNDPSEIRWEFVRLSNGDPAKDMHMHDAVVRFGDDGHVRARWSGWENGKPGGHDAELETVRTQ